MSEGESRKIQPRLVLFLGVLAVSSASIFIRFAQDEGPSLVIAALRLSFAALILTPIMWIRYGKNLRALSRRQLLALGISGFFLALHFATWITSLEYTSVASAVVLVATAPLWIALLSPLVLRERVSGGMVLGMVIAMLGSMLVGAAELCAWEASAVQCDWRSVGMGKSAMWGNLLALAGAWFAAAYLMIGRRMRSKIHSMVYIYVVYGAAAVFLLIGAAVAGLPLNGYSGSFYLFCLVLALFPQLLGHSSYNWALAYLPATYVSISLLGEPIGTIILAYFVLRESPSWLEIAGGVLILGGIYLSSVQPRKKSLV
ncbi:MAG: DMT family transporter [Anaerolineaceae bacterium]|nr:DMT family transporter [Anaerolineaceae bacterium]